MRFFAQLGDQREWAVKGLLDRDPGARGAGPGGPARGG
jgi:hypothetical protein